MKYKTELTQLGNFFVSGQMKVSVPCYKPDVWCSDVLDTNLGTWEAAVLILNNEATGGWGDRVAVLAAKHEDCLLPLATHTINNTSDGLSPLLSKEMCSITLSKANAGVFADGVVTSTGYGDGGYPCIYHTDEDGKVDFAYVIFIGDNEDEEEDY